MSYEKISLTGDLGSGKSAVSKLLSERLQMRIVSTGFIQREIAAKYGMSTLELNEYTKTHPEIDDEIDGKVTEMAALEESLIFDSRLAWHFAPQTFKVYLLVDARVAAERIFNDNRTSEKYTDINEALEKILARRTSEIERFRDYYGINYGDLNNYDLVLETTHATPEQVTAAIADAFVKRNAGREHPRFLLSPRGLLPTRMVCCSLDKDQHKVEVLEHERNFLIIKGHGVVCNAIAANEPFIAVALREMDFGAISEGLRSSFLKQWEDLNFVRFRDYPSYYL
jgi:cytidylate kinase